MASVTQRIKQVKQPRGGYVKPKDFNVITLEDTKILNPEENIHSSLVGIAVDYLTRFMNGTSALEAFKVSLLGASIISDTKYALELLSNITDLSDNSIVNACKLAGYDVCFRGNPLGYKPVQLINPDAKTISNIRVLVERSLVFIQEYGPIVADGLTFEAGYTDIVNTGDCDFLTQETLWDFKVSLKKPTSAHTLQLLMYYLMGIRSIHPQFKSVKKIGVFNPRLNQVFELSIDKIPVEVVQEVESLVIGY